MTDPLDVPFGSACVSRRGKVGGQKDGGVFELVCVS